MVTVKIFNDIVSRRSNQNFCFQFFFANNVLKSGRTLFYTFQSDCPVDFKSNARYVEGMNSPGKSPSNHEQGGEFHAARSLGARVLEWIAPPLRSDIPRQMFVRLSAIASALSSPVRSFRFSLYLFFPSFFFIVYFRFPVRFSLAEFSSIREEKSVVE